MSGICENRLVIRGPKQDRKNAIQFMRSDLCIFDLNKVIKCTDEDRKRCWGTKSGVYNVGIIDDDVRNKSYICYSTVGCPVKSEIFRMLFKKFPSLHWYVLYAKRITGFKGFVGFTNRKGGRVTILKRTDFIDNLLMPQFWRYEELFNLSRQQNL